MSQTNEMVKLAITALEDKKGEDIRVIDIHEVSVLADYFLIASGSNGNQVQAMADNVEEELGKAGYPCKQVEGYQSANWILMLDRAHVGEVQASLWPEDMRRICKEHKIVLL